MSSRRGRSFGRSSVASKITRGNAHRMTIDLATKRLVTVFQIHLDPSTSTITFKVPLGYTPQEAKKEVNKLIKISQGKL